MTDKPEHPTLTRLRAAAAVTARAEYVEKLRALLREIEHPSPPPVTCIAVTEEMMTRAYEHGRQGERNRIYWVIRGLLADLGAPVNDGIERRGNIIMLQGFETIAEGQALDELSDWKVVRRGGYRFNANPPPTDADEEC